MKCNHCGDSPNSIQDVFACKFCKEDGTANEIPKDLPVDHALMQACQLKPALRNRFEPTKEEVADLAAFEKKP